MKYLLWRMASEPSRTSLATRIARVEPGRTYVVDEVARVAAADSHHRWRPGDFGDASVPGKVAWLEWAHDPRYLATKPALGYDKRLAESERFGAFCLSFRIPSPGRRIADLFAWALRRSPWGIDRLSAEAPGGSYNVGFSFAASWRDEDPAWCVEPSPFRVLVPTGEVHWAQRGDGVALLPPDMPDPDPFVAMIGRGLHADIEALKAKRGTPLDEAYSVVDRNALVVVLSCALINSGAAACRQATSLPHDQDYADRDAFGRPPPAQEPFVDVSLDPARVVGGEARDAIRAAVESDQGCVDFEAIAEARGLRYAHVSAAGTKAGAWRTSREECEEHRRHEEAERRREEEASAKAETAARRRERWERFKARRAAARAERERDRLAKAIRMIDADADEKPRAPKPRPEPRPEPRRDLAPPTAPVTRQADDPARPGAGYRWDDEPELFHQGRHWRVVYGTTATGRTPGRDFVAQLGGTAPQDLEAIRETVRIVADDPMGHTPLTRRFKAFSRGDYVLCEFKRSGMAGHSRLFAFRDERAGRDGKVERRIVLPHGYSKQTNATPQEELERADRLHDAWLARRR